jgi:hypothetical protein
METLTQMKCVACRKDAPTLTAAEIAERALLPTRFELYPRQLRRHHLQPPTLARIRT